MNQDPVRDALGMANAQRPSAPSRMLRLRGEFQRITPATQRRLIGPLATLAQKNMAQATYRAAPSSVHWEAAGFDILLLSDWRLAHPGERFPVVPGCLLYDCSDVSLLDDPLALAALAQCAGVLVPNEAAAQRVRGYTRRVAVLPAPVHSPWLLAQGPVAEHPPMLYVFGNEYGAWAPLVASLKAWLGEHPAWGVLCEDPELAAALPEGRTLAGPLDVTVLPRLLRSSPVALFTGANPARVEPGVVCEAAFLGLRVLVQPVYSSVGLGLTVASADALTRLLDKLTGPTSASSTAQRLEDQRLAKRLTTFQQADRWLGTVVKLARQSHVPQAARWTS